MFKRLVVSALIGLCILCGVILTDMATAFDRKIDTVLRQLSQQEDKARTATFRRLKSMQKEVLAELPKKKSEWSTYHLGRVETEMELLVDDEFRKLAVDLHARERIFWDLGVDVVAKPLSVARIESPIFGLDIQTLQAIQADAGMKVVGISDDLIAQIKLELSRVASGMQTPFDAIEKLAASFDDPGIFTTTWHRAERVVINELNHAASVSDHQTMLEANEFLKDRLKKRWVHSRNPNGRQTHIAAESQVIAVKEKYRVAPKFGMGIELLDYPRDWVHGSAANNINCGCDSVPDLAEAA